MIKGLDDKHYLSSQSMFVVMVLKSLRHGSCVNCGEQTKTLEESSRHWEKVMGIIPKGKNKNDQARMEKD